ncbi:MAG: sigma-70 family RNA polymerase sigma factor [Acidimicrobiales bacterium]|nr:sigma-70 family RNA polymerase sigma factor [Acidimicrobiales bacterium]
MERLAAGDGAAIQGLIDAHRTDLVRSVRAVAGKRGARLSPEQIEELVVDVALAIFDVAGSWKPGGAPPWIYARGRIANAVDRMIGQWADELEPERDEKPEEPAAGGSEPDPFELIEVLAARDQTVALLLAGLGQVASTRDQMVFVEHGLQVSMGDPSPAVTVGQQYGMKPATVRQQTRRIRLRLRGLAETDPRFVELASLPLVA